MFAGSPGYASAVNKGIVPGIIYLTLTILLNICKIPCGSKFNSGKIL